MNTASTIVLLALASLVVGCSSAAKRVEAELPPLTPRVLSHSPADQAMDAFAAAKQPGARNMVIALTYVEGMSPELPSVPLLLESLFSHVTDRGIKYLPWDYFNPRTMFWQGKNLGVATPGTPDISVPQGMDPKEAVSRSGFAKLMLSLKNADGTMPRYYRLRIAVELDKDIKAVNSGLIIRALAKMGSEYAEGSFDRENNESVSRITVTLTLLTEQGDVAGKSVVVTSHAVRLTKGDRIGLIVASSGANYYDKATTSHGMVEAVRETIGHGVFVLLCQLTELDHEKILSQSAGGPAGATAVGDMGAFGGQLPGGRRQVVSLQPTRVYELPNRYGICIQSVASDYVLLGYRFGEGGQSGIRTRQLQVGEPFLLGSPQYGQCTVTLKRIDAASGRVDMIVDG